MLRVLVVERSEADANAIVVSLRAAGHELDHTRVDTAEAMDAVLGQHWDVILCDWEANGFVGRKVIELVRERELVIPFIVISREATEDNVVDAMRMGASDFIHKDRLGRLPLALGRELRNRSDTRLEEHRAAVAEARFQHLWSSELVLLSVTGGDGRIVDANPGFERALGFTHEELLGKTWVELTAPESAAIDLVVRERLMTTGKTQPWEKVLFAKDGHRVPVLASVVLLPGPRQAIVMAIDLTERNRLDRELHQRVRIAEATAEVAVEATAIGDLDPMLASCAETIRIAFDAETCRIWTLDAATNTMHLRAHTGLIRPDMETEVRLAEVEDRLPGRLDEWPTRQPRGIDRAWIDEHGLEGFVINHLTVGGVLLGAVVLFSKSAISEMQEQGLRTVSDAIALRILRANAEATKTSLEAQLRQAQKLEAIGSLAGGVAHDFNNMLSVIIGYADFLREGLPAEHELMPDIGEIMTAAVRAQKLTAQLLAFSRNQVLKPRVLDLNALIVELRSMLRRLLSEDIELVIEAEPALGRISADPNQIEQVLMNLVVNARDAMPGNGRVTITTENVDLDEAFVTSHIGTVQGPQVRVSVRDTGSGMSPDVRARVFEPFFTTKPTGKGTGLGLSTVFGIVKQSGGALWVESEVGAGTTFELYFPLASGAVTEVKPRAKRATGRGAETILLCEDEPQVRTIVREILQRSGYRVLDAVNGEEAIAIAGAHRKIDLLVTDVVMPHMNGRQLSERLLAEHPSIRVLYMSGYTDDAIVRSGVSQDGVAFIQKPLHPDELVRKVRDVLDGV